MKFLIQGLNQVQGIFKSLGLFDLLVHVLAHFQERIKSIRLSNIRSYFMRKPKKFWNKVRAEGFNGTVRMAKDGTVGLAKRIGSINYRELPSYSKKQLWELDSKIRSIGSAENMDDFEKRKLGLFNQNVPGSVVAGKM